MHELDFVSFRSLSFYNRNISIEELLIFHKVLISVSKQGKVIKLPTKSLQKELRLGRYSIEKVLKKFMERGFITKLPTAKMMSSKYEVHPEAIIDYAQELFNLEPYMHNSEVLMDRIAYYKRYLANRLNYKERSDFKNFIILE